MNSTKLIFKAKLKEFNSVLETSGLITFVVCATIVTVSIVYITTKIL